MSVIACPERDNYRYSNSTELHYHYNVIDSTYRCLYDTYRDIRRLYSTFYCLYICIMIIWYSMEMFYIIIDANKKHFLFSDIYAFIVDILALFVLEDITSQL